MNSLLIYFGVFFFCLAACYGAYAIIRKKDMPWVRRVIGLLIVLYGGYLATLTGSASSFVVPGFGAIGAGAGVGAGIGLGTWAVLGTVGVVTGGVGVAVGAAAMAGIGALLGGAGGAAGGLGFQTVTYPLIAWYFWLPIVVIGVLFLLGIRKKRKERLS